MTTIVDRSKEFPLLEEVTYLDHAGSCLASQSQMKSVFEKYSSRVYANPHSAALVEIEECRQLILDYVQLDNTMYDVIFTSGTTGACKLIGESLMTTPTHLCYSEESHTSIVGLRELAESFNVLSSNDFINLCSHDINKFNDASTILVAFPAMSNFCGTIFEYDEYLNRLEEIKSILNSKKVLSLMDACCLLSFKPIIKGVYPDMVTISFYKIFGYPSGSGALIVKKSLLPDISAKKKYFGGGTVDMYTIRKKLKVRKFGVAGVEDGTLPFHSILASVIGFKYTTKFILTDHASTLALEFYNSLISLKYSNKNPVVEVYGNKAYNDFNKQGPIVNFNILNYDASFAGYVKFAKLCDLYNIRIRSGCVCNFGACQKYLGLTDMDAEDNFYNSGHVCGDDVDLISGKPSGSIRVSFGYYNVRKDWEKIIYTLKVHFIKSFILPPSNGLALNSNASAILNNIFLYPVKSCGPYSVSTWTISESGSLAYDRKWVIVRGSKILTQKTEPLMALISPELNLKSQELRLIYKYEPKNTLLISLNSTFVSSEVVIINNKNTKLKLIDEGNSASEWLENILGLTGLKLMKIIDDSYSKNAANTSNLLIINLPSLNELYVQSECSEESSDWMMNQFRCNLAMSSTEVLEENKWKQLTSYSESICITVEQPCDRCSILSVDQSTGKKCQEPLKTLAHLSKDGFKFGVLGSATRISGTTALFEVGMKFHIQYI